jgi:C4-dicarboxylate-specific signal transduction histidine kinase
LGTLASRRLLVSERAERTAHAQTLVQLAEAERAAAVGHIAAAVAHRVSSPLAVVKANATYLASYLGSQDLDPDVVEAAKELVECTDRIERVLAQLRGLFPSHPEAPSPINVSTMFDEAIRAASARSPGAKFQLDVAAGLPPIWVGRHGLNLALIGLFTDLAQAAAARRIAGELSLLVSASLETHHILIRIVERPTEHHEQMQAAAPEAPEASTLANEALTFNLGLTGELLERSRAKLGSRIASDGGIEVEIRAPLAPS